MKKGCDKVTRLTGSAGDSVSRSAWLNHSVPANGAKTSRQQKKTQKKIPNILEVCHQPCTAYNVQSTTLENKPLLCPRTVCTPTHPESCVCLGRDGTNFQLFLPKPILIKVFPHAENVDL